MYNNRARSIEIPENLFSNLGEIKSKKIMNKSSKIEIPEQEYLTQEEVKLTNYANKNEYRDRITKIYEDIKDIKPIDSQIDDVLYFNNYIEKGIVVKPKVSSLKQFWTEYRLINNEKAQKNEINETEKIKLDELDNLFDTLSIRISEINKYIDELKEMRINIDLSNNQLKQDKEKLSIEREEFLKLKEQEENRINAEKENLKINFERLQTIIDALDKKLESIDK